MNKKMDETNENKSQKQAKTKLIGKNMTLEQVKQEALAMIDRGETYRTVAEVQFKVDGVLRRFSISQISNWKKVRDNKASEEGEASMASKAFKLFEEGKDPVQIVINLSIEPEDADEYFKKYKELKAQDLNISSDRKRLEELESAVEYLEEEVNSSVINPYLECGNPSCSAKDDNNLKVELVCSVCGQKKMQRVNDLHEFEKDEDE